MLPISELSMKHAIFANVSIDYSLIRNDVLTIIAAASVLAIFVNTSFYAATTSKALPRTP